MTDPIEGLVSAVLNVQEVAINRGSKHGVTEGMIFAVLAEAPLEITDPETDEVLTKHDREKVRVKVTEVGEKYAIASTFKRYRTGGPDLDLLLYPFASRERVQTLKVEDSELPSPLSEAQSYVKRGDRVHQVIEAEAD